MKAFFEKINTKTFLYCLKYNQPFEESNVIIAFDFIKPKYHNRLKEILETVMSCNIRGDCLKYLPNNVTNKKLDLNVWYYDKDDIFPENWEILTINFRYPRYMVNQNKHKIPKSFKIIQ